MDSNNENHRNLEDRIQSLVDGELDSSDRRELLQRIDANHPEHWRYTALGFVEHQILRESVKADEKVIPFPNKTTAIKQWAAAACLGLLLLAG